ncbi:MAG: transporter substrate-binding domain-containing protein [Anaerolineae bacterium]
MTSRIWERARRTGERRAAYQDGEVPTPPRLVFCCSEGASLALVLLVLGLLLVACGARTGRLDRITASGMLRVAMDPSFPPFESVDTNDQIVGLDADLAQAIADQLGVEAHTVTTNYDALYDALTADRADIIISALYPDPSRSKDFAFSAPYFDAGLVLVTLQGAAVASASDLAGKSVACVFGTAGHMQALQWQETLDPPPTVVTVDDPNTIMALLQDDTVVVIVDHVTARIAASEDPDLRIVMPPLSPEPYVVAVRREDKALFEAIDAALQALQADGTLDSLTARWLRR